LVTDEFEAAQRAAKALRLELHAFKLENPPYDFTAAFQTIAQTGAQMLLILSSPLFSLYRNQIAELAIELAANYVHLQDLCRSRWANVLRR
jgi:hypothetical protein